MNTRQAVFEQFASELAYPLDQDILVGGNYRAAIRHGDTVYVSGQLPRNGSQVMLPGRVGEALTLAQAQQAARICVLRALHVLHRQLGSLDTLAQVLQMTVYTQSAADFTQQSEVADAASSMLQAVLGEAGIHSRTSVGVYQLPKNASVELNLTVALHSSL
ncbi:MAG: RidA family protein [Pseudomonadota bacterium]